MNKYLELMYEEAAEDLPDGRSCPFCDAAKTEQDWQMKSHFLKPKKILNVIWHSQQGCECELCPHYHRNKKELSNGGLACITAGKRVWRSYRDFFNNAPAW